MPGPRRYVNHGADEIKENSESLLNHSSPLNVVNPESPEIRGDGGIDGNLDFPKSISSTLNRDEDKSERKIRKTRSKKQDSKIPLVKQGVRQYSISLKLDRLIRFEELYLSEEGLDFSSHSDCIMYVFSEFVKLNFKERYEWYKKKGIIE